MPKKTTIRQSKDEVDMKTLIEKYGKDTAPNFDTMVKAMLSTPSLNAPTKIAKR